MIALHRLLFVVVILLATAGNFPASGSAVAATSDKLAIARITPSGEDVPAERQVVIEFDRAVVPLGRMERDAAEIPVEISPALACEWRWLTASALACQLKDAEALKPSTRYTVTVNPSLKAEDGTVLSAPVTHEFITTRAALDRAEFTAWSGPGEPSVLVTFNQPVRRDSVVKALRFHWVENGEGERAVQATQGEEWTQAPDDALVAVPREPGILGFFKRLLAYFSWFRPDSMAAPHEWARRAWVVTPVKPLPLDTEIELDMKPGLVSGLGPEQSIVDQQIQKFATFGAFKFLGARCTGNDGKEIVIRPGDKDAAPCGPWYVVRLAFSAPVKSKEIRDHVALSPELGKPTPDTDPWANADPEQTEGFYPWKIRQREDEYTPRFPIYLRSDRDYEATLKPGDKTKIVDMFGRPLEGDLSVRWRMDNRPPNFELPNNIAVLEKQIDSDVPLWVNNLTDREFNFSRMTVKGTEDGLSFHQKLDPIRNLQYAIPFGVRDMLEGKSGAILGTMTVTPNLPNQKPGTLFAQATPFSLHVKLAHYNTLVWVSDLATAAPVAGVKVSLYRDPTLLNALCENGAAAEWTRPDRVEATAVTDADGLATLPGSAPAPGVWESPCAKALTIRAEKDDDLAVMPLYYQFEADTYRASGEQIWAQDQTEQEHMRVWGTTAQGVYRAGDTIQYKVYVRGQNNEGLTAAPPSIYRLQLVDPTGKLVADLKDVSLNEFGATSGEIAVPKTGAVGWYKFRLLQKLRMAANEPQGDDASADAEGAIADGDWFAWKPMQVLVSDFTPASFRVTATVKGKVFAASQPAEVEGKAELHSGGPYTNATARITAMFDPQPMTFEPSDGGRFRFFAQRSRNQFLSTHARADGSAARRARCRQNLHRHSRSGYGQLRQSHFRSRRRRRSRQERREYDGRHLRRHRPLRRPETHRMDFPGEEAGELPIHRRRSRGRTGEGQRRRSEDRAQERHRRARQICGQRLPDRLQHDMGSSGRLQRNARSATRNLHIHALRSRRIPHRRDRERQQGQGACCFKRLLGDRQRCRSLGQRARHRAADVSRKKELQGRRHRALPDQESLSERQGPRHHRALRHHRPFR